MGDSRRTDAPGVTWDRRDRCGATLSTPESFHYCGRPEHPQDDRHSCAHGGCDTEWISAKRREEARHEPEPLHPMKMADTREAEAIAQGVLEGYATVEETIDAVAPNRTSPQPYLVHPGHRMSDERFVRVSGNRAAHLASVATPDGLGVYTEGIARTYCGKEGLLSTDLLLNEYVACTTCFGTSARRWPRDEKGEAIVTRPMARREQVIAEAEGEGSSMGDLGPVRVNTHADWCSGACGGACFMDDRQETRRIMSSRAVDYVSKKAHDMGLVGSNDTDHDDRGNPI